MHREKYGKYFIEIREVNLEGRLHVKIEEDSNEDLYTFSSDPKVIQNLPLKAEVEAPREFFEALLEAFKEYKP